MGESNIIDSYPYPCPEKLYKHHIAARPAKLGWGWLRWQSWQTLL